ncbi:MAG: hydrolase 2, exosortase A system-associated [Rhodoferax sp.]|nr:hydrolase 2, exosortase A system-associated [Rhodoferax sp.]
MAQDPEPFFTQLQPGELGRRFCVWHAPAGWTVPLGLVVHVHAFAEEMNKSRRMVALQARTLSAEGYAVLQTDLLGCGDSAGDFADATWGAWLQDVVAACALAQTRFTQLWPGAPAPALWLWGQRAGALLAAQAVHSLGEQWNLLLWQPSTSGKSVLQQFLRLDTVGSLMGKGGERSPAKAELGAGRCANIAGYAITPALAQGLEAARLEAPVVAAHCARLEWIELGAHPSGAANAAVQPVLQSWADAGWAVRHRSAVGPGFWLTTEIQEAPALLRATLEALRPNVPENTVPGSTASQTAATA